eukprot:6178053-Pleurochrysis_carterae.AAC.2
MRRRETKEVRLSRRYGGQSMQIDVSEESLSREKGEYASMQIDVFVGGRGESPLRGADCRHSRPHLQQGPKMIR